MAGVGAMQGAEICVGWGCRERVAGCLCRTSSWMMLQYEAGQLPLEMAGSADSATSAESERGLMRYHV